MDKSAFNKYMGELKKFNAESTAFNDCARSMFQGGFSEVGFRLMSSYCDLLSEAIGDTFEWVAWYCFENDFGAKKWKAGYDGNEKPIRNLDDLWRLINEGKGRK
jgi:hypothetical protein